MLVVGALAFVLLAAAIASRLATESVPRLAVHRTLTAYVRLPGSAPVLAWPYEGQAAVEVGGVGSFGASGASTPVPIASVAKVMTAYLTLRQYPLAAHASGFVLKVTRAEVAEQGARAALGESTVPVRAGERITERQALQALLLPSANNVAAMLAVHDAGGLAAFVTRMNATAKQLGMRSTTYTDPSGFNSETVSTAADQLKLARVAMREPAFATIVDEPTAELPVAGRVMNYNALVGRDGYIGVKTGSDRAAGGCLVFARRFSVDGHRLTMLGVVLGQHAGAPIEAALASAQRLGSSAAAAVRVATAIPAGAHVLTATSTDGQHAAIVTADALRVLGWAGLRLPVEVSVHTTTTRLRAGAPLARVTVSGAAGTPTTAAVARRALSGPSLGWRLRHLL